MVGIMSLLRYSKRFCSLEKSDLLVIYTRVNGQHALFDERDSVVITSLIERYKIEKGQALSNKLTIMIHSQGGDMIHAIKLISHLQKQYKEIDTVVFNVAKSCMTLASLSGQFFYLNSNAGISDFSINHDEKLSSDQFNIINFSALEILVSGVLVTEKHSPDAIKEILLNLVMTHKKHGTTIPYGDIKKMLPNAVRQTSDHAFQFHLSSIHNFLIDQFDNKSGIYKIMGFNGEYTHV